jgi:outer membrane protein W
MKKGTFFLFFLILFSSSLLLSQTRSANASAVQSEDTSDLSRGEAKGRFGIGLITNYGQFSKSQFSGGIRYGADLWLRIAKNFAIELEGLIGEGKSAGDPSRLSKGKLSITTLLIALQGRLFADRNLVPFLKAGGGYSSNKFSLDSAISSPWNQMGFSVDEKIKNSWVYFVGAGVDFFLGKNFVLNGDLRYSICKAKGSWTIKDQISNQSVTQDLNDINLNSFGIGLGLRFVF